MYNIADFLKMYKLIIKSCLNNKFPELLSSFKTCWGSLLRLLMALGKRLLQIDEASLFETFGSLKIRTFWIYAKVLAIVAKINVKFRFILFVIYFFIFLKCLTIKFPYFQSKSLETFIIFLDSTNLKIVWNFLNDIF